MHMSIEKNYSLHYCFKMEDVKQNNLQQRECWILVQERSNFHYDDELVEKCPDNVSLHGFFQSEKYFKNVETSFGGSILFHDEHIEPCKEIMEEFKDQEPIMLHVRRGDPNLTDPRGFKWSIHTMFIDASTSNLDYYESALAEFDDNQPVFVFSDSVDWVKEQEFFSGDRFLDF